MFVFLSSAFAVGPIFLGPPLSPPRDDAPVDGVIVVEGAQVSPIALLTTAEAGPMELPIRGFGAVTGTWLFEVEPPAGGWPVDQALTVDITTELGGEGDIRFDFISDGSLATPPGVPIVTATSKRDWTDDTSYPWGCCVPTRVVEFTVEAPDDDPWAGVELVGRFDLRRESQITTNDAYSNLDLSLGGGTTTLRAKQWRDDSEGVQPPCFAVYARNAAGIRGEPVEICAADGPRSLGCTHARSWSPWTLWSLIQRR